MRLLYDNPILMRDLRMRFREKRYIITVTLALGFLFLILSGSWPRETTSPWFLARAGREIFAVLAVTLLTFMLIITSTFAATSLSSEKEARTIETLFISTTTDWEIVLGKLNAANVHNLLTLAATFPLTLSLFALGGISALTVAGCYALIAVSCYTFSAMGIFWSAVFLNSTRNASGMTILTGLVWVGLPMIAPLVLSIIVPHATWRELEEISRWTLAVNPYLGVLSLLDPRDRIFNLFGIPLWPLFGGIALSLALLFLLLAKEVLAAKRRNHRP